MKSQKKDKKNIGNIISVVLIILLISLSSILFIKDSNRLDNIETDKLTVERFYNQIITRDNDDSLEKNINEVFAENWEQVPAFAKTREDLPGLMKGFKSGIPDIRWEVKEIVAGDDGWFTVVGTGFGTPVDTLFGEPVIEGKSFEVMSIDLHKVEDGKIVKSYHVEDWYSGINQVTME